MVIACPNCQRKYQIDTTRIPAAGTSFTCWSCRATVRVDPVGVATAQPKEEVAQATTPTVASAPRTPESNIPLSAMRFFESLANEASLNQKMAEQPPTAPPTPPASEPVTRTAPFPAAASTEAVVPAQPARVPGATVDLMTGDDVLDLPPVVPAAAPVEEGRVVDIPALHDVPESREFSFAPAEPEPEAESARPSSTMVFSSEPPSLESEPTESNAGDAADDERPAEPTQSVRPWPQAIPLPAQALEPEPTPEPFQFRGTRPTPVPPPPPAAPVLAPPAAVVPEPAFAASQPVEPARASVPMPTRMTPAEMAVARPSAWVAPGVSRTEGPSRSGRGLLVLSIVALVTIVVVAAIWWRAGLGELFRPQTAVRPAPQQQQPAPAQPTPTAPALPPEPVAQAQAEPTTSEPPPAATTPERAAPAAPAGDGNFTVQVRSSPDESDARAAAQSLGAAGVEAYVVRADLGARGVWYRVRVGRYATRDEASQAAAKLRSSGRASDAIVQSYEAP